MPVQKQIFPLGWTAWSLDRMRPESGVSVVRTSQLLYENKTNIHIYWSTATMYSNCNYAKKCCSSDIRTIITLTLLTKRAYFAIVMRPTLFSGLLRVLEWQTMLTASCWACSLVGRKSPFLMYSLLSTLRGKYQVNMDLIAPLEIS